MNNFKLEGVQASEEETPEGEGGGEKAEPGEAEESSEVAEEEIEG